MATEKDFDLVKLLEESCKQLDADSLKMAGRKEGYEDVIKFITNNKLKITIVENNTSTENNVESKESVEETNVEEKN